MTMTDKLLAAGRRLADIEEELGDLSQRLADCKREFRSSIDALETERRDISHQIRTGQGHLFVPETDEGDAA